MATFDFVQGAPGIAALSSVTATLGADITAGNTIIVGITQRSAHGTITGDLPAQGFAFIGTGDSQPGANGGSSSLWYKVADGSEGNAISVQFGSGAFRRLFVAEYEGAITLGDVLTEGVEETVSSAALGDITTVGSATLLVCLWQQKRDVGAVGDVTLGDSFTERDDGGVGGASNKPNHTYGDRVVSAGDYQTSFSTGVNIAGHACVFASFTPGVPPVPMPGNHFDVYTPDGVFVVRLDRLLEKKIRVELNGEGSGHFVIDRNDEQATAAILQQGNIVRVTFDEIDPDPIWEFILKEGDFALIDSDEEGGEELSFGGPGSLSVLRHGIVHPIPQTTPTEPWERMEGHVKWLNQEAGNIIRRLIEEAELRGVLGGAGYDITRTFTNTDDTDAVPWTPMGSWIEAIGTNLYDAVMKLVAAGQLHIEMAVGLILNAYQTIGEDRTGTDFGAGIVRFVKGVNIADELHRGMPGGQFFSHAIIRGSDGDYEYTNLVSYDYAAELYLEVNSDDATVLEEAGDNALGVREDSQEALIFAMRTPYPGDPPDDAGLYLPGPEGSENGKFWIGDLVTLHTGSGEFDYTNATHRVYAITLYEDETGHLAPPIVELNAPFLDTDEADNLSALPTSSSGSSSGGGGSGGGTTPHIHTLGSLGDVDVKSTPPDDGDPLTYDSALGQWVPGDPGSGATPVAEDGSVVVAAPTQLDFRHGLDVTDPGGGPVRIAVDETELSHASLADLTTGDPHTQYASQVEFDDHSTRHDFGGADVLSSYVLNTRGGREVFQDHGNAGSTETIDLANGNIHILTLDSATCTLTFTGSVASFFVSFSLLAIQDATGGRLITWPASVTWIGGVAPTLSTTGGMVDLLTFFTYDNGTTWIGVPLEVAGTVVAELDDLSDVNAPSPADGDLIQYDGAAYVNVSPDALLAAAGHWEIVMEDGVTAPPVPITNEAEDDWIYAFG